MSMPAAVLLAESDTGKGSPIGLFVVLLLVIAVFLLYRSMTGHLRRLPERFPPSEDGTGNGAGPADAPKAVDDGTGAPTTPDGGRTGPS